MICGLLNSFVEIIYIHFVHSHNRKSVGGVLSVQWNLSSFIRTMTFFRGIRLCSHKVKVWQARWVLVKLRKWVGSTEHISIGEVKGISAGIYVFENAMGGWGNFLNARQFSTKFHIRESWDPIFSIDFCQE